MQVHDDEGVAIRIGPEPCDGARCRITHFLRHARACLAEDKRP